MNERVTKIVSLEVYSGCNTTGELLNTVNVDVYPGMPVVPAILTRNAPIINPAGCNMSNLCTIIFYDAGHSVLHNVWTNWPKEHVCISFLLFHTVR